ncbi:MAG: hypothetical protein M1608_13485, partial [Candidatus Omnitrophica bacterium]|nr:hypothetical protein [Candidatus Omnitrophota bacterium]
PSHPDAKEKAKNDGAISNDKGLSVHLIRQDKNRLDKKGGGGASNDKSVNGDRPLYIREYDSLITDAREEIQRLSFLSDSKGPDGRLKPEILKTIQDLKERIREWKSAKFGVQLPGPKSRTQDNQPQSQA